MWIPRIPGGVREGQRRILSIQGRGPHSEHLSLTFLYLIVKLLWLEGCISFLSPFFQKYDLCPLIPTCKLLGPTWGWNRYLILQCWKSYWKSQLLGHWSESPEKWQRSQLWRRDSSRFQAFCCNCFTMASFLLKGHTLVFVLQLAHGLMNLLVIFCQLCLVCSRSWQTHDCPAGFIFFAHLYCLILKLLRAELGKVTFLVVAGGKAQCQQHREIRCYPSSTLEIIWAKSWNRWNGTKQPGGGKWGEMLCSVLGSDYLIA